MKIATIDIILELFQAFDLLNISYLQKTSPKNVSITANWTSSTEPLTTSVITLWSVTPIFPGLGTDSLAAQGLLCQQNAFPSSTAALYLRDGWMANTPL